MKLFELYRPINENKFKHFWNMITSYIKDKFSSFTDKLNNLSFGQKTKFKVDLPLHESIITEKDSKPDLKSRIGYLTEYYTGLYLAQLIDQGPGNISVENIEELKAKIDEYKRVKIDEVPEFQTGRAAKEVAGEVHRADSSGKALADQLYKDMVSEVEDLSIMDFDISLTGDALKGKSKADLVFSARKKDTKEIVNEIYASLKSYKAEKINLANNTYISWVKTMLFSPKEAAAIKSVEDLLSAYKTKFGLSSEVEKLIHELKSLQDIISAGLKDGGDKAELRKKAKESHGRVIEILIELFNDAYEKDKVNINDQALQKLGMKGSKDDIYAAVTKKGVPNVVSGRSSQKLKELYAKLNEGFDMELSRKGNTNQAVLSFNYKGHTLFESSLSFADTGGKGAQGKINNWVDILKIIQGQ